MDVMSFFYQDVLVMKLFFGVLIGLCLGLTGVGGGVLIIPILQVVFGLPIIVAVGTASIIAALTKISAAIAHVKAGNVVWSYVKYILLGAIPTVLITTSFIVNISQHEYFGRYANLLIEYSIIAIMIFSLFSIIKKYKVSGKGNITNSSISIPKKKPAFFSGVLCGSVMGSTGIGGGVLLLPLLNNTLGVDIKKSVGTSIVLAVILSSITAISYSSGGKSDYPTAISLVIGSFIGVPIAMNIIKKLTDSAVYLLTIYIIVVSLLLTIFC